MIAIRHTTSSDEGSREKALGYGLGKAWPWQLSEGSVIDWERSETGVGRKAVEPVWPCVWAEAGGSGEPVGG